MIMEGGDLAYQFYMMPMQLKSMQGVKSVANIPKMTVVHTLQTYCNDATTDDK